MLYLIRIIVVFIFVCLSASIGILLCLVRPFNPYNLKWIARIMKYGTHILGIEVDFRNAHNFVSHPSMIVSNHQENMDVFIGAYVLPEKTFTVGKKSILYIPFFGLFYWLSGNILINRNNKKSAYNTMDVVAEKMIKDKISIWILAEGTRSRGRGVLPFKKGAFISAIKAQVPIVPIAISSYKSLNFNRFKSGKVIVEVMPAISTVGLTMDDVNDLKNKCQHLVSQKVNEIDLELKS